MQATPIDNIEPFFGSVFNIPGLFCKTSHNVCWSFPCLFFKNLAKMLEINEYEKKYNNVFLVVAKKDVRTLDISTEITK